MSGIGKWLLVVVPTIILAAVARELDPWGWGSALAFGIAWGGGTLYADWEAER